MTDKKKVTMIGVDFQGRPTAAKVLRHCQEKACMLGRYDIINYYKLTPSSYNRILQVVGKYAEGQIVTAMVAHTFNKRKE